MNKLQESASVNKLQEKHTESVRVCVCVCVCVTEREKHEENRNVLTQNTSFTDIYCIIIYYKNDLKI